MVRISSVDDEQGCPDVCARSVWLGPVGNFVAHSLFESESSAVGEVGFQAAGDAQKDVTLGAPMIGTVVLAVPDHADTKVANVASSPFGMAGVARVRHWLDGRPVDDGKRYV